MKNYLLIDSNRTFAEKFYGAAACKTLSETENYWDVSGRSRLEIGEISDEIKAKITDDSIILINAEAKTKDGSFQDQSLVELAFWFRCKHRIKNPIVFYSFRSVNQLLKTKPEKATFINTERDKNFLSQYCADDENIGTSGTALDQFANSKNIGACIAAQSAGIPTEFVGSLTNSKPEKKLIAALGGTNGSEASLLGLMGGYSIFAENGKLQKPTAYKSAFQADKNVFLSKPQSNITVNPDAVFVTNEMMKAVIENGTASNFRQLAGLSKDVQISGKTGSGMIADLWFIGLTPRVIVGVWIGMTDNLPLLRLKDGFTGGKIAAPLAAKFMKVIKKYRPELLQGEFHQPEGVIKKRIDPKTGCLVDGRGKEMFFIKGRESLKCK